MRNSNISGFKNFSLGLLFFSMWTAIPQAQAVKGIMFFPLPETDFAFTTPCVGGVDTDIGAGSFPFIRKVQDSGPWLFLAGNFTHVGKCGSFAMRFSASSGLPSLTETAAPAINGGIWDAISDNAGGFFIWGNFTSVNGLPRSGLARINADGSLHPFNVSLTQNCTGVCLPNFSNLVTHAALDPVRSSLFIVGSFRTVNGQPRKYIAKVNSETGTLDPLVLNLDCPGFVFGGNNYFDGCPVPSALAFNPTLNHVYLAGDFHGINGNPRRGLAAIDGTSGIPNGWNPSPDCNMAFNLAFPCIPSSFLITRLDWFSNVLYVSGSFNVIAGTTRNVAAAFNTPSYSLIPGFNPNPQNTFLPADPNQKKIHQFLRDGPDLLVVGKFTSIGGLDREYVARLDPLSGAARAGFNASPTLNPLVHSPLSSIFFGGGLSVSGSTLYVAGDFYSFQGTSRFSVAALNKDTGALQPWDPRIAGTARKVIANSTDAFVFGDFTTYQAIYQPKVAKVSLITGLADPSFAPIALPGEQATDLLVSGNDLFVSSINLSDASISWVTKHNAPNGARNLLFNLSVGNSGTLNAAITKMVYEVSTNSIFVSGLFADANGVSRNYLAKVSAATGAVSPFNSNIVGTRVSDMVLDNGQLYLAGDFNSVGAAARNNLAKVDANTGAVLPSWSPNLGFPVGNLWLESPILYVSSSAAGTVPISRVDTTTGAFTTVIAHQDYAFLNIDGSTGTSLPVNTADIAAGAQYTNNSQTFTVRQATPAGSLQLNASAAGPPTSPGGGILTRVPNQFSFNSIATSRPIQQGAIYTNNAQTFTFAQNFGQGVSSFVALGTGAPSASGVLTLTSGEGPASISFSSFSPTVGPATIAFSYGGTSTNSLALLASQGGLFTRSSMGNTVELPQAYSTVTGAPTGWSPSLSVVPAYFVLNEYLVFGSSYRIDRRSGSSELAYLYGSFVEISSLQKKLRLGVNQVNMVSGEVTP